MVGRVGSNSRCTGRGIGKMVKLKVEVKAMVELGIGRGTSKCRG